MFTVIEDKVLVIRDGQLDTRPVYIVTDLEDRMTVCSVRGHSTYCRPVAQRIAALLNLYGLLDIEAELAVEE